MYPEAQLLLGCYGKIKISSISMQLAKLQRALRNMDTLSSAIPDMWEVEGGPASLHGLN